MLVTVNHWLSFNVFIVLNRLLFWNELVVGQDEVQDDSDNTRGEDYCGMSVVCSALDDG